MNENEKFVSNSELSKRFEKLDIPNWSQYYPIHKELKSSSLSSISEIDMEEDFSLDFENEEKFLKESHLINEIRKLGNNEQLKNE